MTEPDRRTIRGIPDQIWLILRMHAARTGQTLGDALIGLIAKLPINR